MRYPLDDETPLTEEEKYLMSQENEDTNDISPFDHKFLVVSLISVKSPFSSLRSVWYTLLTALTDSFFCVSISVLDVATKFVISVPLDCTCSSMVFASFFAVTAAFFAWIAISVAILATSSHLRVTPTYSPDNVFLTAVRRSFACGCSVSMSKSTACEEIWVITNPTISFFSASVISLSYYLRFEFFVLSHLLLSPISCFYEKLMWCVLINLTHFQTFWWVWDLIDVEN